MYGEATTSLQLTKYTYSSGNYGIYVGGSTVNTGDDQADFIQAQYNADINYRNDTTTSYWNKPYDPYWRPHVAYEHYYGDRGAFRFGGWKGVNLSYANKADIKIARLGVKCTHFYMTGGSTYVYVDSRVLNVKLSTDPSLYGSGQALVGMSPDLVHPCSESNRAPSNYIYYDLDLDYIHNLTTGILYIWFHVPFELMPWRGLGYVPYDWFERVEAPDFTLEVYV